MNPLLFHITTYVVSFLAIWFGAGLVVSAISKLSHSFRLPAFTLSFFILGMMTSLPEISIGLTSLAYGDPQIFVGNLIGGVLVLFLLVIPLLAVAGNGIGTPKDLSRSIQFLTSLVVFLPTFFIRDQRVERWEAIVSMGAYIFLFLFFSKKQNLAEKFGHSLQRKHTVGWISLFKIMIGVAILAISSTQIIESTLFFSDYLQMAPFFVSLIIISIGSNIPELTLVFRFLLQKKQQIALAEYMGSAAANTFLFGIFVLMYPGTVVIPNHYFHRFFFVAVGLVLTFFFIRSNNRLSKVESAVLLLLYISFIAIELLFVR